MAERELPKIRIRFEADDSSVRKAVTGIKTELEALNSKLSASISTSKASAVVREAAKQAMGVISSRMVDAIKQLANGMGSIRVPATEINNTAKKAIELARDFFVYYIKKLVNGMANVRVSASEIDKTAKKAIELTRDFFVYYIKKLVDGVANLRVSAASINQTAKRAIELVRDFFVYYIKKLVDGIANVKVGATQIGQTYRAGVSLIRDYIIREVHRFVDAIANVRVSNTQVATAYRTTLTYIRQFIIREIHRVISQLVMIQVSTSGINSQARQMIRDALDALMTSLRYTMLQARTLIANQVLYVGLARNGLARIVRRGVELVILAIERAIVLGAQNINVTSLTTQIGNGISRALRSSIAANLAALITGRAPAAPRSSSGGGRSSSSRGGMFGDFGSTNGMLGTRADIYMNINSLRSMASASQAFIGSYKQFEQLGAQMEAFSSSSQEAAKHMKTLQDMALRTPYSVAGITKAVVDMAAYGETTQNAITITERLGDIAMGSADKFGLLSYALAQIRGRTVLQGQELRQLTEQGFNPLEIISKETGITLTELDSKMRKHEISVAAVYAAIDVATSKGGRFANMQYKMAQTVTGLSQQIMELIDLLKNDITATIADDIKQAMRVTIAYLTQLRAWVNANKDLTRSILMKVRNVLIGLAAIKALALAFALVRWNIGSFIMVFSSIRFLLIPVTTLIGVLVSSMGGMSIMFRLLVSASALWTNAMFGGSMLVGRGIGYVMAVLRTLRLQMIFLASYGYGALSFLMKGVAMLSGTLIGLTRVLTALRVGAALTWLAFLGPIPLIVGGIALVGGAIYAMIRMIQGSGGIRGAIMSIWDSLQWFAEAAQGFFYNFAENMDLLGKWMYNNWWNIMQDIGDIFMRGLSMIPGLVLAAFSTGGRLIVAWGHWLVSYLPTAIYNAFVAAGKFIYDFFQRVLNAGKEVWKYITDPSRWGNDASKVLDTLLADRKAVDEEGILAASKQIISDGMQQAKETSDAAFKGFKARTEALPAFNLNIPETKAPDAPPMPEAPDKIDHNWNDLLGGKAAGAQVKAAADAVMAGSADHAKRVWEAMQRSKATKAGAPSQDPQQKANSLLQRIERNTRAAQGGGTPVAAANIANSSGTVVYTMKGN